MQVEFNQSQPQTAPPPRTRLDFGQAFNRMWKFFSENWKRFVGLSAIKMIGFVLYMAVVVVFMFRMVEFQFDFAWFADDPVLPLLAGFGFIFLLASALVSVWVSAGQTVLAHRADTGEERGVGTALHVGSSGLGRLLLYYVLIGLATLVFMVPVAIIAFVAQASIAQPAVTFMAVWLLILFYLAVGVVSFWLSIKLAFVSFAIVIEGKGVFEAVARSWRLTDLNFWRTAGVILLVRFAAQAVMSIVFMIVLYPLMIFGALGAALTYGEPPVGLFIAIGVVFIAVTVILTMFWESVSWSTLGSLYAGLRKLTGKST